MALVNRFSLARRLITVYLICCVLPVQAAVTEITSDIVYAQAVQIEKEVNQLKRYYNIAASNPVVPVNADLKPYHVLAKSYVILIKLSQFRSKQGLQRFSPLALEPAVKTEDKLNWAQTQRILTEVEIIKTFLGIPGGVSPATPVQGKRSVDVFNKLNQISYDLDTLNGEPGTPSMVYSELRRINEDVNVIMRYTVKADTAFPPTRLPNAIPADSLHAAFEFMNEIQKLLRKLALDVTDYSVFDKTDNIVPADVFNMVTLCFAELQRIKAQLGMNHAIASAAEYQEGKTPADVTQLLGYMTNKLHLVNVQ